MYNHTPADAYILHIAGQMRPADHPDLSPSDRVVRTLQAFDSRVVTGRFRSKVLEAIYLHALIDHFNDDEEYVKKLIPRLELKCGKKRARRLLIKRCEILESWQHRDATFR